MSAASRRKPPAPNTARSPCSSSRSRVRPAAGIDGAVELFRPALEGADHAAHRLAEQRADKRLKHARAEFEIDIEIDDARTVGLRLEFPMVFEIAKGPLTVGDVDAAGPAQRHACGE